MRLTSALTRFYWSFLRTASNPQVSVYCQCAHVCISKLARVHPLFCNKPTMTRRSSRQPQDRGRVIRFSAFARAHLTRSLFPFLHLSAASNTAIFQVPLQRAHGINERLKPHHSVIATRPFRDLPTITLQFVLQMPLYASTPAHLRIQPRLKQRRCITEAGGAMYGCCSCCSC